MSDNWLQYIPTDPQFQPTIQASIEAKKLLSSFVPKADSINAEFSRSMVFYHPGTNWSGVNCPACGINIEPWWEKAMEDMAKDNFTSLDTLLPCCGAKTSFNELNYLWPAGFARFVLEAMNPNILGLSTAQLTKLNDVLHCIVREIAVHI